MGEPEKTWGTLAHYLAPVYWEPDGLTKKTVKTLEAETLRKEVSEGTRTEKLAAYSVVNIVRHRHHHTLFRLLNLILADFLRQHTDRTAVWVVDAPPLKSSELATGRSAA